MDKKTAKNLNRRLLANFMDGVSDFAEAPVHLKADIFFDDALFEREKTSLYLNAPQPIAFSAEIPDPNSFLALEVLNIPILLVRNKKGVLKAFINACTHRGGKLADGDGHKNLFTCSFHGWSFDPDGNVVSRPQEACFHLDTSDNRSDFALTELPVSETCGVVIIGLKKDIGVEPADAGYESLASELQNYNLKTYKALERKEFNVAANWKLINDLSLESYHFPVLHRDTVAQILAETSIFDAYDRCSRWAFPWKSIGRLNEIEEKDWPEKIEGSCTYTLFPGVMLILNASGAQMIRAEPGERPNHTRISYVGLAHPETNEAEARSGYEFGGKVFEEEDLVAAIQCQKGLEASRKNLILGTNEALLQFWHRIWAQSTK
ncbi:MAG TPA: hypothetical protein DIS83_03060 [Rhodobiaceae bacterium]|nr:hypothetical protein [Rhodobiaceae bacterium]